MFKHNTQIGLRRAIFDAKLFTHKARWNVLFEYIYLMGIIDHWNVNSITLFSDLKLNDNSILLFTTISYDLQIKEYHNINIKSVASLVWNLFKCSISSFLWTVTVVNWFLHLWVYVTTDLLIQCKNVQQFKSIVNYIQLSLHLWKTKYLFSLFQFNFYSNCLDGICVSLTQKFVS